MSADMPTTTAPQTEDTLEDAVQQSSNADRRAIREKYGLDIVDLPEGDNVTGALGFDMALALVFVHYRRTHHVGTDEAFQYAENLTMTEVMSYFAEDTGPVLDNHLQDVSPQGEGDAGAEQKPGHAPAGVSTPDSPGTSTTV